MLHNNIININDCSKNGIYYIYQVVNIGHTHQYIAVYVNVVPDKIDIYNKYHVIIV